MDRAQSRMAVAIAPDLREHADFVLEGRGFGERRVHPDGGVDDAHRVGPDEARAVSPGELDELTLRLRSGGPGLTEPRGDDHDRSDTLFAALLEHVTDRGRGHGQDGEVRRFREIEHGRVGGQP